jgi:hypothetical protein
VFRWARDKESTTDCRVSKIINSASPLQSLLYIKSVQALPVCPDGSRVAGTLMPPPAGTAFADPAYPPLTQQEAACVEQFVFAATTGIPKR